MKRLVEETFSLTAKQAAKALPAGANHGMVEVKITDLYVQQVSLVSTPGNAGGIIYWFMCPGCRHRVRKLYLPLGEAAFLCRKCHNLGYAAQQSRAFKRKCLAYAVNAARMQILTSTGDCRGGSEV